MESFTDRLSVCLSVYSDVLHAFLFDKQFHIFHFRKSSIVDIAHQRIATANLLKQLETFYKHHPFLMKFAIFGLFGLFWTIFELSVSVHIRLLLGAWIMPLLLGHPRGPGSERVKIQY